MILEVSWDGLCTLSFGLSQFHGHGSWLVCEVVLNVNMNNFGTSKQFDFLQIFVLDKDRNNFHERKERKITMKPICISFDHELSSNAIAKALNLTG